MVGERWDRLARRALISIRGAAIDAGLLPYRPAERPSASEWNSQYEAGAWGRLGDFEEWPRYGVIAGFVRAHGRARSLLDYGCGEGLLLRSLTTDDFETYLGIDVAEAAIARARRTFIDPEVSFELGATPPVASAQFDVVVCNEVLYYLDNPDVVVQQLHDLLDEDGLLITSVWRHDGSRGLDRLLARRLDPVDRVKLIYKGRERRTSCQIACWRPRRSRRPSPRRPNQGES